MLLAGTFAFLIAVGTILLALPLSHARGAVSVLDALFTAASAVCVTGLITVDTPTAYTRFGQSVIVILIQLGGLGIMTFGAVAADLFRIRLSFSSEVAWRSAFFDGRVSGNLRQALRWILIVTFACEAAGTIGIWSAMQQPGAPDGGLFNASFLAVSAFCNAGFSVYTDSVMDFSNSMLAMFTIAGLIIAGGLGYATLLEVGGRFTRRVRGKPQQRVGWSLHTYIVLRMSLILIVAGALALLATGLRTDSWLHSIGHALFQSVTARTAGFNSVVIGNLPTAPLLILIALMFVGGSPGSCAGGVKTTTIAVWLARVRTRLVGGEDVVIRGRRVPHDVVRRAALVLAVGVLWNLLGVLLLSLTESGPTTARFEGLIFEQISAFATVGLSTGITPTLSVTGKLWIIATMFVGRVGPLTVALAFLSPQHAKYRFPPERVMIG